jgi:hypothetical protein
MGNDFKVTETRIPMLEEEKEKKKIDRLKSRRSVGSAPVDDDPTRDICK